MADDLAKLSIDRTKSGPAGRRRRFPWIKILLLLALIGGGAAFFLTRPIEVKVGTVSLLQPSQTLALVNAGGYVVASRKSSVAAKTTGKLAWIGVEEGSRVNEGEIIARLENDDALAARDRAAANVNATKARIGEAQAELSDAQVNHKRLSDLMRREVIARAEFDVADARLKRARAADLNVQGLVRAAQAQLAEAQWAVEYTLVRAPFDGVVLTKNADVGDIVTPLGAAANAKSAVVSMADPQSLQIEVDVAESNVGKIVKGGPVEIRLDSIPEERFAGYVHMIVPTADRSKATVMVKVRFAALDPRVLPEMSVKTAFLSRPPSADEKKPVLVLPPAALVESEGGKAVFTAGNGTARLLRPVLGRRIGDFVEATSGLAAGAKVILNPPAGLRDGARVRPVE